jgi:nitrate/TMAO reductase-like tetraheme cytochrome c subunit
MADPSSVPVATTRLQQAMIEKLADIPRMERGQPDALLVKLYADEQRPDNPSVRMNAVPFDHKAHEGYNDSCRVCHHAELTACASCHTIEGATEGKQVKLAQAMHQRNADASCVGCHNQEKEKPTCAGCHSSIPQSRSLAAEDSCKSCHLAPIKDHRMPTGDAAAAMAAELLATRPGGNGDPFGGPDPRDGEDSKIVQGVRAGGFSASPHRSQIGRTRARTASWPNSSMGM